MPPLSASSSSPPLSVSLPSPPISVSAPSPPFERVVAGKPAQRVVQITTGDRVVESVAGADERIGVDAGVFEVLHVGHELDRERGHLGFDRVGAGARGLDHHVGEIVDDVGVVAGQADHRVGIEAAVEQVVVAGARAADQQIVAGAAEEIVVAGPAEDQVVAAAAGDHRR